MIAKWKPLDTDKHLKLVSLVDFVSVFSDEELTRRYQYDYEKYALPYWVFNYEGARYIVYKWITKRLYVQLLGDTKTPSLDLFANFLNGAIKEKKNIVTNDSKEGEQCPRSGERQRHGFLYEALVIQKYGLSKSSKYTSAYDATYENIPVQIKCIKHGCAIELGDYKRNKQKQADFILIVGFWKGDKKNIIREDVLYIDYRLFVDHLRFDGDNAMIEEMKLITNLRIDDGRWGSYVKRYKNLWPKTNLIDIRFKRDHKKQKRIQCAISWSNWAKFSVQFPKFEFKNIKHK
jgi:hypothetical protein